MADDEDDFNCGRLFNTVDICCLLQLSDTSVTEKNNGVFYTLLLELATSESRSVAALHSDGHLNNCLSQ